MSEIVCYGYWRVSVKHLQFYCQCLPVSFVIAKILFRKKMFIITTRSYISLQMNNQPVKAVVVLYNIKPHQIALLQAAVVLPLSISFGRTLLQ